MQEVTAGSDNEYRGRERGREGEREGGRGEREGMAEWVCLTWQYGDWRLQVPILFCFSS